MSLKIINEKLILKSKNIKNKKDLFEKIAFLLYKNNFTKNQKQIEKDLLERENLGSTAFENGLMIPHCRTSAIKEPKLVIVTFEDQDFNSIDGLKTNFSISILVPKDAGEKHLKILSKLSLLFSKKENLEKFKKLSKEKKVEKIQQTLKEKTKDKKEKNKKYDFVAVTSCAAGIAHTYMARDGLIDAAKKLGLNVKVETRGAITENSLSEKEIEDAKFVIIAADVNISTDRFSGKKLYITDTNFAIRDGKEVIEKAKKSKIFYGKASKLGKLTIGGSKKNNKQTLGKAVMSALSFMIPIVIVGGILMSIPNALASSGSVKGGTWHFPNSFAEALWNFGHLGLILMVPIFAMFLAFKIGGKPAMPAALIGGYFINDGALMTKFSLFDLPKGIQGDASAGFLGGILVGILVGYMIKALKWIKWHRWLKPVSNLMLLPIISSFLTFLIITYIIGTPVTWLMFELFKGLKAIEAEGIWLSVCVGMLFAVLMSIDLGGPINKTTLTVATVIFTSTIATKNPNFVPQTAVQAAISVPPLGMWLSTIIFKKKFSNTELAAGKASLPMGLVGITEGALPFAFKTPLKAIFANISGAIFAGGLVSFFQIHFYGGLGSPLGSYIGYATNTFYGLLWILSILVGVVVTGVVYGLLRNKVPEYELQHEQRKKEKIANYNKIGLNNKKQIIKHHLKNFKFKKRFLYSINPKNWIENPNSNNEENEI